MSYETEHTAVRIDELQKLHEQNAILREALEEISGGDRYPEFIAKQALQRAGGGGMSQTNFEDKNPYLEVGRMKRELSILREALVRIYRGDGLHGSVPAWELMLIAKEALQRAGGEDGGAER